MEPVMLEPVIMVRGKETRHKPCKMMPSKPSGAGSGSKKRKKTPNKTKPVMQRVMVITKELKTSWIWRTI